MTPAAERAAAREAIYAPQRLAAAAHCWVFWHSVGRAPVRCTVQPDHHDGPHDFTSAPAAPAERT